MTGISCGWFSMSWLSTMVRSGAYLVHQHNIDLCCRRIITSASPIPALTKPLKCLTSVVSDPSDTSDVLQLLHQHSLIDEIVFNDQDFQRLLVTCFSRSRYAGRGGLGEISGLWRRWLLARCGFAIRSATTCNDLRQLFYGILRSGRSTSLDVECKGRPFPSF